MGEAEGRHLGGIWDMGPSAEVSESAVAVESDLFPLGNAGDDIELEFARLRTRCQAGQFSSLTHGKGLIPADDLSLKRLCLGDDGGHFFLDRIEILGTDPMGKVDVVVETILDRRSCCKLSLGPDAQDRICQNMGAGVADRFEFGHENGS